jgi:membrane protease YdiL (CAAX protease family)
LTVLDRVGIFFFSFRVIFFRILHLNEKMVLSMTLGILQPLFFESTKTEVQDPSDRIVGKAILTGVSVYIFLGPVIAAVAVVAHLVLATITKDFGNVSWFAKNHAVGEIKKAATLIPVILKVNLIFGLIVKLSSSPGVHQIPLRILVRSFYESPSKFLRIFLRIIYISPVIEEIIFRGFLQEKIRDIQVILFKGNEDSTLCKVIRVIIQSLLFACVHFHPLQGLANIPILMGTFIFGFYMGLNKEREKTLWTSITIHSSINTIVCSRVILFGG